MIIGNLVEIAGNVYKIVPGVNNVPGTISFLGLFNNLYLRHFKGYCRNDSLKSLNNIISKNDASFYPVYETNVVYSFKCSNANYSSSFISKYLGIASDNRLRCRVFSIPQVGEKVRCEGAIYTICQPLNKITSFISLYNDRTNTVLNIDDEVNFVFTIYKQEYYIIPQSKIVTIVPTLNSSAESNCIHALYNDNTKAVLNQKDKGICNLYLSVISDEKVENLLKIERLMGYIDNKYFEDSLSQLEGSISHCLNFASSNNKIINQLLKMFSYNFPASNVPPVTGFMRKFQMLGVDMLRLVDQICRANNLSYCLCSGSLVGAVRHHGYVPWDDDIDIVMTITDFHKLRELLNSDRKYFIYANDWIYIDDFEPYSYTIHNTNNNSWIDIFVLYYMPDNISVAEHSKLVMNIKSAGLEIKAKSGIEAYRRFVSEELDKVSSKSATKRLFKGLQSWDKNYLVFETDSIFPLKELSFEGFYVYVPNKYEKLLMKSKGNFYDYPHSLDPAHITSIDKIVYKHE